MVGVDGAMPLKVSPYFDFCRMRKRLGLIVLSVELFACGAFAQTPFSEFRT